MLLHHLLYFFCFFVFYLKKLVKFLVELVFKVFAHVYSCVSEQILFAACSQLFEDSFGYLLGVVFFDAREAHFERFCKVWVRFSGWEGFLPDLDGLKHSQIPDLSEHVVLFCHSGLFFLIGLDAANEVVGGGA